MAILKSGRLELLKEGFLKTLPDFPLGGEFCFFSRTPIKVSTGIKGGFGYKNLRNGSFLRLKFLVTKLLKGE